MLCSRYGPFSVLPGASANIHKRKGVGPGEWGKRRAVCPRQLCTVHFIVIFFFSKCSLNKEQLTSSTHWPAWLCQRALAPSLIAMRRCLPCLGQPMRIADAAGWQLPVAGGGPLCYSLWLWHAVINTTRSVLPFFFFSPSFRHQFLSGRKM